MLRIHNVKVKLGKMDERKIVSQVLNVREKAIRNVQLSKQSIDARQMIKKLSLLEVDQRACFVLIRLLVQGRMLQS